MDASFPWVCLWLACLLPSSQAVSPPTVRCPRPPACSLTGNWSSLAQRVQVRAWMEGGGLEVEHWSGGLTLHGHTRLPSTSLPAFVSVLVGSRTTPGLCLHLMLACVRSTLWVTELPLAGSVPAVAYPLQRHVSAPSHMGPENYSSLNNSLGIAHSVLVNITLYHNVTADEETPELGKQEEKREDEDEDEEEIAKDAVEERHLEDNLEV